MKPSKEKMSGNKKNQYYGKIIGIIFIIIGIVFLFTTFSFRLKLAATLLFIGFVILLMINGKETDTVINNIHLVLIIILLIFIIWLITINVDFDIFFILIMIVIIALKEFLGKFLNSYLQKRLNILFYTLLAPLVIIFVQRIINILSMYSG